MKPSTQYQSFLENDKIDLRKLGHLGLFNNTLSIE